MKRELGKILQQEFGDPRMAFVSVTHVDVSRDLRHARVHFSYLGEEKDVPKVSEALRKIHGYVRKLVGEKVRLRNTPEIEFVYDQSILYSARVEETLQELHLADKNSDEDNEITKGMIE